MYACSKYAWRQKLHSAIMSKQERKKSRLQHVHSTVQREEGAAGSSAGGSVAAAAPMFVSPGAIEGLTFVSAAGH